METSTFLILALKLAKMVSTEAVLTRPGKGIPTHKLITSFFQKRDPNLVRFLYRPHWWFSSAAPFSLSGSQKFIIITIINIFPSGDFRLVLGRVEATIKQPCWWQLEPVVFSLSFSVCV